MNREVLREMLAAAALSGMVAIVDKSDNEVVSDCFNIADSILRDMEAITNVENTEVVFEVVEFKSESDLSVEGDFPYVTCQKYFPDFDCKHRNCSNCGGKYMNHR